MVGRFVYFGGFGIHIYEDSAIGKSGTGNFSFLLVPRRRNDRVG